MEKLKKINQLLNIIIGSFVGVFIGHVIYVYWEHNTYSEYYLMNEVPWYTSILVYGIATGVILLVAVIAKIRIVKKLRARCTGCRNRCLLSNPKCDRGRERSIHIQVLRIDS